MILKTSSVLAGLLLATLTGCGGGGGGGNNTIEANTTTEASVSSQSSESAQSVSSESQSSAASDSASLAVDLKLVSAMPVDENGAAIDMTSRYEGGSTFYLKIKLANEGTQDLPSLAQYGYKITITSGTGNHQIYKKIDAANMPILAGSETEPFIIDSGYKIKNENNVSAELTINNYGDSINDDSEFSEANMQNNTLSVDIPIYPVDLSIIEEYNAITLDVFNTYTPVNIFSLDSTDYFQVGYIYTIKNNSEHNFYGDYTVRVTNSPFVYLTTNLININTKDATILAQDEFVGNGRFFPSESKMTLGVFDYVLTLDPEHILNDENTANNSVSKSLEVTE